MIWLVGHGLVVVVWCWFGYGLVGLVAARFGSGLVMVWLWL